MGPLRQAISWLVTPRPLQLVFPGYLFWGDVVEIDSAFDSGCRERNTADHPVVGSLYDS